MLFNGKSKANPRKELAPIVLPEIDGTVRAAVKRCQEVVRLWVPAVVNVRVEPPEPKYWSTLLVIVRAESALAQNEIVMV